MLMVCFMKRFTRFLVIKPSKNKLDFANPNLSSNDFLPSVRNRILSIPFLDLWINWSDFIFDRATQLRPKVDLRLFFGIHLKTELKIKKTIFGNKTYYER
jgi:hypothetical protein